MIRGGDFKSTFLTAVEQRHYAERLKDSSCNGKLKAWTDTLTEVVVGVFETLGYTASARKYENTILPLSRSEYLGIDVMAFSDGDSDRTDNGREWLFPVATVELENQLKETYIAYSLWKLLLVQSPLRILICYRAAENRHKELLECLKTQVIQRMNIAKRSDLHDEIIVVIGCRSDAETFPYGFFTWKKLDTNTGTFLSL